MNDASEIEYVDTLPADLDIPLDGLTSYVGPYKGRIIAWHASPSSSPPDIVPDAAAVKVEGSAVYGATILTAEGRAAIEAFLDAHYKLH